MGALAGAACAGMGMRHRQGRQVSSGVPGKVYREENAGRIPEPSRWLLES
ncbi:hypothetical protein WG8_5076 [Paenibacillus sp. Aloe-11]|nr:hypothetical protein WG8_5076 [Paenibacillus sp. Aloe-11]